MLSFNRSIKLKNIEKSLGQWIESIKISLDQQKARNAFFQEMNIAITDFKIILAIAMWQQWQNKVQIEEQHTPFLTL